MLINQLQGPQLRALHPVEDWAQDTVAVILAFLHNLEPLQEQFLEFVVNICY